MTSAYLMKPTRELLDVLAASQRRSVEIVGKGAPVEKASRSIRTVEEVLEERESCPRCLGCGHVSSHYDSGRRTCPVCNGTGKREPVK